MYVSTSLICGVGFAAMTSALSIPRHETDPLNEKNTTEAVCWCVKKTCKFTCCESWCWEEGDCCLLGEKAGSNPLQESSTGLDVELKPSFVPEGE